MMADDVKPQGYVYHIRRVKVADGLYIKTRPFKGMYCEKVASGPRRAIVVRFTYTGELVLTNALALRKVDE